MVVFLMTEIACSEESGEAPFFEIPKDAIKLNIKLTD